MPICDRNALTIVARLEVRGEEREELMMQRCVVREVGPAQTGDSDEDADSVER